MNPKWPEPSVFVSQDDPRRVTFRLPDGRVQNFQLRTMWNVTALAGIGMEPPAVFAECRFDTAGLDLDVVRGIRFHGCRFLVAGMSELEAVRLFRADLWDHDLTVPMCMNLPPNTQANLPVGLEVIGPKDMEARMDRLRVQFRYLGKEPLAGPVELLFVLNGKAIEGSHGLPKPKNMEASR